jgi:predicted esterase
MNQNNIILNPKNKHMFTFILLHGMGSNTNSFNNFLHFFENDSSYKIYFKNTKFIIPASPIINVHYPQQTLYNINSWYDYYTQYDGKNKIDKINTYQFYKQTRRILSLIKSESNLIKNKNIYCIGISQGGTLLFNILKFLKFKIGGIIPIDTIYMNNYIKLNFTFTPISILTHFKDEIYPFELQNKCYNLLRKKNININQTIFDNGYHAEESIYQYKFILNSIFNI